MAVFQKLKNKNAEILGVWIGIRLYKIVFVLLLVTQQ